EVEVVVVESQRAFLQLVDVGLGRHRGLAVLLLAFAAERAGHGAGVGGRLDAVPARLLLAPRALQAFLTGCRIHGTPPHRACRHGACGTRPGWRPSCQTAPPCSTSTTACRRPGLSSCRSTRGSTATRSATSSSTRAPRCCSSTRSSSPS